jgi:membrane-associated protein
MDLINFILHIDKHLTDFVAEHGTWVYGLLFAIVFVETGVVVMPLLPGDSLLFAAGAIAARGQMDPLLLTALLTAAAVIGDNCNYFIGRYLGPRVFEHESRWIKREYLLKTHAFFELHGPKAIIIARFMPIIRTFTPFIAGVGSMSYRRFLMFDIFGGALWVSVCVWAGFFFGNIPVVQKNFTLVIFGIIGVSLLPGVIAYLRRDKTPA